MRQPLKRRSRNNQRVLSYPAGEIVGPIRHFWPTAPSAPAPPKTRIALNAAFVGKTRWWDRLPIGFQGRRLLEEEKDCLCSHPGYQQESAGVTASIKSEPK